MSESGSAQLVEREVRVEDPSLSPDANRLLTQELRERLGTDRVKVPADAPRRSTRQHARRSAETAALVHNRPLLLVVTGTVLVTAVATTLATGSWWAATAVVVLAVTAAVIVTFLGLQLTTQTEHLAPELAARLEEEGVPDPDKLFTDLLEEYAGVTRARGTAEIISGGANEQGTLPEEDGARAAVEQRTTWTPSSSPGTAAGSGSAVAVVPWVYVGASMLLSLLFAIIGGGDLWVLPTIVVPIGLGFFAYQLLFDDRREEAPGSQGRPSPGRHPDDRGTALRTRIVPIVVGVALVAFVVLVVAGALNGAF